MRNFFLPLAFFIFLTSLFFYKTILYGYIPLPVDSLVGGFEPYRSYSVLGYAPSGVPHKAQGPDVIRMLYPWKMFSISQLQQQKIPLWNPYNFSGKPHMAGLQSGVFYPFNGLFIFGAFFGWILYIMIQPVLSGIFTYFFLREISVSKSASFFGGTVFSFCSFLVVWLQYGNLNHAFLWLPFVLWAAHKFIRTPGFFLWLFFVLSLLLSFLAGYAQFTFYVYVFAFCFIGYNFILDKKSRNPKKYILLLLGFIASLLLGAFQLLPMLELIGYSAREPYTFQQLSKYLLPVQTLIGIVFPDIFGNPASRNYWGSGTYIERVLFIGVIPFIFALFSWKAKNIKYVKFFSIGAFISLISTLDILPVRFFHSLGIPFLSTTVPTRILGLFAFSLSVLSAIGMDYWIQNYHKKIWSKMSFFITLISVVSFLLVYGFIVMGAFPEFADQLRIMQRNMILPLCMLGVVTVLFFSAKIIPRRIIIYLFFLLTIFDLFYFFQKITPFSPKEFVYPETPVVKKLRDISGIDRSWGYGSAFIENNFYTQEKLFTSDGYDPLFIKRYGEFIAASKNGNVPDIIPRSDVILEQGYGGKDLEENSFRLRVLDLLGVKYILNKKDHAFPKDRYGYVWGDEAFEIYENINSVPRIFLASNYVIEKTKDQIIKRLFDKQFNPKTTIVLEETPNIEIGSSLTAKTARLRLYSPNKVIIDTESDVNTLLYLSDNYYQGWKVSIDGKDGTIYRANYTFRAVPVEKGKHEVIFFYKPESFRFGLYTTFITMMFIVLLGIFGKKYGIFKNA